MKIDKNKPCYVSQADSSGLHSMSYNDAMELKKKGKLEYLTQEGWDFWQNIHGEKVESHKPFRREL